LAFESLWKTYLFVFSLTKTCKALSSVLLSEWEVYVTGDETF
jgi:hypothetical protein